MHVYTFDLGMKLTFGRDVMFALKLKLESFFCKDASGRKTYTKG